MADKTVSTYWWNESPNFGDAMNPLLLREIFGLNAVWAPAVSYTHLTLPTIYSV